MDIYIYIYRYKRGYIVIYGLKTWILYIYISDWWFGTFFVFPYIGNNTPNYSYFQRGYDLGDFNGLSHLNDSWLVHHQVPLLLSFGKLYNLTMENHHF